MIKFYNKHKFKELFYNNNNFQNYFTNILTKEYEYRYNLLTNSIFDIYYKNIINFSKKEMNIIVNLINSFKNQQNWNFFKLDKSIDKGMPFTVDNYIFIPSNIFDNDLNYIRDTLIHEQIHIHQYNNIESYIFFYKKCGFDLINDNLKVYIKKKYNILSNPDSPDIFIYNKQYIPLIIINNNNKNHETYLYNIKNNKLESIDLFKKIFNINNNLSSPHEIFAEKFVNSYILNYK